MCKKRSNSEMKLRTKLVPPPERQPFDFPSQNPISQTSTQYSPFCHSKPVYFVLFGIRPILHNFFHLGHGFRVQCLRLPLGHSSQELEPWPNRRAKKGKPSANIVRICKNMLENGKSLESYIFHYSSRHSP